MLQTGPLSQVDHAPDSADTDRELLWTTSILRCPISSSDLCLVPFESLPQLKTRIAAGELRHAAGTPVQMQLEGALSSTDGEFIYPIVDGILVLLPGLAIAKPGAAPRTEIDTVGVMQFYDEVGWHITKDGKFEDTRRFEDVREVSRRYVHSSYMRVRSHIPPSGEYLLDVACGPIPYPEYLTYSEDYGKRLCVDFSIVALRAAKERLGAKGIYIQGDITRLPLKDATVDGFVSLHTIYHVPAEKQGLAFQELERVLKTGGSGAVVYSWGSHVLAMKVLTQWIRPTYAAKLLLKRILPAALVNRLKKTSSPRNDASDSKREAELYFHPHEYAWFQREVASRPGWELRIWRAVSVGFLQQYVHPGFVGRWLIRFLLYVENAAPRLCGRFGQYPMMIYTKAERISRGSNAPIA